MMNWPCVLLVLTSLTGCIGSNSRPVEISVYDLGIAAASGSGPTLRSVEVHAPTWLATPEMQYRLAYADASRRRAYGESRWAATPAEMLELGLRRAVSAGTGDALVSSCRLRVDLDEFVQVFDSAERSRTLLEVRISLLAAHRDQPIAQRGFSIDRPAPSADARGGVAALSGLAKELSSETRAWLTTLIRESSVSAAICRGG